MMYFDTEYHVGSIDSLYIIYKNRANKISLKQIIYQTHSTMIESFQLFLHHNARDRFSVTTSS